MRLLPAALALTVLAVLPALARPAADERSAVLLERECGSELSRQELTLFANGTVRLRERGPDEEEAEAEEEAVEMFLGELAPDELQTYVERLQGEDLGEVEPAATGPEGAWVEACRLTLHFDAMTRWIGPPPQRDADAGDWVPSGDLTFRYGRFDRLSLPLSRVVSLLDLVESRVDRAAGRRTLPPRYRPEVGDVLRRSDGVLFRVERPTADGNGWELQGVEQPLTLYVVESDIPELFTEVLADR